jgi:hypothetical protein
MTKKELKWRLTDLPTGDEVASLVEQKVITTEEARQILFNEDKDSSTKVKELEEEVKFLRELCDKLAAKTTGGWQTIVHEYRGYHPYYHRWYGTYGGVINTLNSTVQSTAGINGSAAVNSVNLASSNPTNKGIGTLQANTASPIGLSSLN